LLHLLTTLTGAEDFAGDAVDHTDREALRRFCRARQRRVGDLFGERRCCSGADRNPRKVG
jgi:hypothetical protein